MLEADARSLLRAASRWAEEVYVQDQAEYIGEKQAVAACHREVSWVADADRVLKNKQE